KPKPAAKAQPRPQERSKPAPAPRPRTEEPPVVEPAAPAKPSVPVVAAESTRPDPMPAAPSSQPAPAAQVAAAPAAPAAAPVEAPRYDAAYLRNPPPAYPRASRRLGEQGRVVLRVRVEANGRPSRLEVQASSGSPRLDDAALDAVRRWSFVAARRGSESVAAWVLVPLEFRLNDS